MSNYYAPATHPKTGKIEDAAFLDNHFGRHKYGVQFADGSIYPAEKVQRPTEDFALKREQRK